MEKDLSLRAKVHGRSSWDVFLSQTLEKFGRDLTAAARQGKIDPVIGRDEEIRRVMQVLMRRMKNNPVLIGEAGVRIQDSALVASATLSHRYISDRFLPDRAVDLIDEAAWRLRMELDSMPTEVDQLERQVVQLEIEQNALKKEKDPASKERLGKIERQLAELKEKSSQLKASGRSS